MLIPSQLMTLSLHILQRESSTETSTRTTSWLPVEQTVFPRRR